jgi:predicted HAD superfamily hydrolase
MKKCRVSGKKAAFDILYGKFAACVDRFDVVSFDVFDTLISRKVPVPADIFGIIERRTGREGFARRRVAAERAARRRMPEGTEDVSLDDIYNELEETDIGFLKQSEIGEELDSCYRNENGYKLYDLARKKGRVIIAVSDMYLPSCVISKILSNAGYTDIKRLFLSNEYGKTKSTGRLFSLVPEEINVANNKIIHIGDNYRSDVLGAGKAGIRGLHFPSKHTSKNKTIFFLICCFVKMNHLIYFIKKLYNPEMSIKMIL